MEPDVMTLKEAADYLKLNEKSLSRLAQDGRIPARKLVNQWRFHRSALDSWLAARDNTPPDEQHLSPDATGLPAPVTIANAIAVTRINLNLSAPDRSGVLRELSALVLDPREERLFNTLFEALRAREDLCPTCISEGVAIPHARNALVGLVDRPILAYGRHRQGVDFGAIDGKPVHHFFLLCAPNVRQHLQLLSRITRLINNPDFRNWLDAAQKPEDIVALIQEAEPRIVGT